jgi:hypothetical protein
MLISILVKTCKNVHPKYNSTNLMIMIKNGKTAYFLTFLLMTFLR